MSLFSWLKHKEEGNEDDQHLVNAGFCPNCWGQQSYDGKFVDAVKDK